MNPSNRNNFVFVFTTILLLIIFGVEMLNMALLVLKAKRKQIVKKVPSNAQAMPEQCPSKSVLCRTKTERIDPYHVNGDPMWQIFVSVQKFIRTKFC